MKTIGSSVVLAALTTGGGPVRAATFADDVAFLGKHVETIVLSDKAGQGKVALVPAYQGRIMTSTATGDSGLSFGWLNRDLIASGKFAQHINVFGGEDRFWLGPEGGQYSIFFGKGVPFDLEHWFTPAPIDTEPFHTVSKSKTKARFRHEFTVTNYSGTIFNLKVDREVKMLTAKDAWKTLGVKAAEGMNVVAFESANKITNTGKQPWQKETGLLSVWILGMFNPSPATTIVVPINPGPESELGVKVTSDYFGQVPPERLVVKDSVIYFSGDGKYRSKIGINPQRSKAVLGSYDAANKALTIVQFTQPEGVTDYVNSLWKLQDRPYGGDAANSYNDGPPAPGAKPLGPFYELESSSPAAALKPRKSLEHVHRTIHMLGSEAQLDTIARATLGVSLQDIMTALPK
jgi:hypothetical protein